jgi:hypothetical protein
MKEKKTLAEIKADLDMKMKELSKVKSENDMKTRMLEKNKMITEKKEEKNLQEDETKNNESIEYFKKKLNEALEQLDRCKKLFDDMALIKQYEADNVELIVLILINKNRIEKRSCIKQRCYYSSRKDCRIGKFKDNEFENY